MITKNRRLRWAIPLLLLFALPLGGAAIYRPRAQCELVADWVAAHPSALMLSAEELASYPREYQRAIFNQMPVKRRAELGAAHLRSFVLPTDSLTSIQAKTAAGLSQPLTHEQGEFILIVIRVMAELSSPTMPEGEAFIRGARLTVQARKLFNDREFSLIFKRLGPEPAKGESTAARASLNQASMWVGESLLKELASKLFPSTARLSNCACDSHGDCDDNQFCGQTYPPCSGGECCWWPFHCDCNGTCQWIE